MTIVLNWVALVANILVPISIIIFSTGFFPYKPLLPGFARYEETNESRLPPAVFDKVIFMVVDALRSDFVFSNNSGFTSTQSLIRSGVALPFTAHASSPTVTMPRLKAITTGSVPSFLDVILNVAESDTSSALTYQDTWLAQLKARGDKLIMYGDDTWLKLFPGMFDRADGTKSFFVSDFTEVDNNVTRHISNELIRDDWSGFIMHYLGLDHIGHKAGPESPYMVAKQHEMDSVVSQVYTALGEERHLQNTLFVLCGDHGMNDAGNHGGSSVGETSPALLFISPKFALKGNRYDSPTVALRDYQYYRTIEQTDITPTLAGLLGLPIPLNSLGVFIPELLAMWDDARQRLHMLFANSKQLLRTVKEAYPNIDFDYRHTGIDCDLKSLTSLQDVQCAWFRVLHLSHKTDAYSDMDALAKSESALLLFSKSAQRLMSSTASNYSLQSLYLGLGLAGFTACLSLLPIKNPLVKSKLAGTFLLFNIISHSITMFASSYVEEEQEFWYWTIMAWAFYLHIKSCGTFYGKAIEEHDSVQGRWLSASAISKFGTIGLAVSYRVLRRWNQTGQKFTGESDIARSFFHSHQDALWALVFLTYTDSCSQILFHLPGSKLWRPLAFFVTVAALGFKLAFVASDSPELLCDSLGGIARMLGGSSLVFQARVVLCGIFLLVVLSTYSRTNIANPHNDSSASPLFHELLTLFLITQSKVTNIPVFLVFRVQVNILASMRLTTVEHAITCLLMEYMTFYAFGGSNSISSVDLSNAYNGIAKYNVITVGVLTFTSNWAAPIWWVSATRLLRYRQSWKKTEIHVLILTFHTAAMLMSVMAACTVLRTHLFIWTVFSPKYLFSIAWAIFNHTVVNVLGEFPSFFFEWR
ncbi:alkaline phosphatase-like protein [Aspergillus avenaceus]|uniref:GPI ethanolamine phosphate transferase 2 n=1 Tax=Aspergillus avenaceus TaxID=36643 RepID=A0A5N6TH26_ASPAV|nr:alkaline phosphatase-like protein [Aspergillus avenaceus]